MSKLKLLILSVSLVPLLAMHLGTRAVFSCLRDDYHPLLIAALPAVELTSDSGAAAQTVRNVLVDRHLGPVLLVGRPVCDRLGVTRRVGKSVANRADAVIVPIFDSVRVTFYDLDRPRSTVQGKLYIACQDGGEVQPRVGLVALAQVFSMRGEGEEVFAEIREKALGGLRIGMSM